MAVFPGEPGSAGSALGPAHPPVSEENLWQLLKWFFFKPDELFPAFSVKALNGTQSTDPDQWPDLILSLSTTRLLMEETFLPLRQLSNRKLKIILLYLHFLLLLSF